MLPRGLTGRIVLAFTAMALAILLAVGGSVYFVLHGLHQSDIKDTLSRQVTVLIRTLSTEPVNQWDATLQDFGGTLAGDGGFVILRGPAGGIRVIAGNPSSLDFPPGPTGNNATRAGIYKTSDGKAFAYVETNSNNLRGRVLLFTTPDKSSQMALGDLSRALLVVVLVLLLVGIPIAWLLSRSLSGPMKRLTQATTTLPAASGTGTALPLEGPTEVRALTERFNAMARELASTRSEETQLLANLRHDLRTPLTSIAGYAEAIADGTASGERATAAARTIAEEAQRLERLVGEIGVVERLRQGPAALRPEALDAAALLSDAAARFEGRAAGQNVTIEVLPDGAASAAGTRATAGAAGAAEPAAAAGRADAAGPAGAAGPAAAQGPGAPVPPEPGLRFTGDRLAVERILQNLLDNALSVLPDGGHVWLHAAPLKLPDRSAGVAISVTDDGPGFPPGTQERVFERFFRADPSRSGSGSGLGLAIVRELARAHGGEAWVENVAPHGARVSVLLPISPVIPIDTAGSRPAASTI